jgi:thioredoxin-like negative regulator of GroEL
MRANRQHLFSTLAIIVVCLSSFAISARQSPSDNSEYQAALKHGAELMKSGLYADAVNAFKDAIRLSNGKDYAAYWGLAQTYNQLKDKLNTFENCDRMIALAPTDAIRALGHNLEGLTLASGGAKDQASVALAESEFRTALKLDPANSEIHFNLGKTLLLEKREEDAAAELNAYLIASPKGPDAGDARQLLSGGTQTSDSDANLVGEFSADPSNTAEDAAPVAKPPKGTPAPNFSFKTLQGARISSGDLRGKVVLVDFWATWCGACKAAFPALEELYEDVDKSKVVVISVSVDQNEAAWRQFLSSNSPQWTQTRDTDHKMRRAFITPLYGIPSYILIDGNGVIRQRYTGWSSQIGSHLKDEIDRWTTALPSGPSATASKSHK